MRFIAATVAVAFSAICGVSAHGHLAEPFCRGCEKYTTDRDSINSPIITPKLCRGEPAGRVTDVSHDLTLSIDTAAPHTGPCSVYLLDEDLGNSVKIADKYDCAAPNKDHTWALTIPATFSGRKVLRWTWEGCHVSPCEKYEQCSDINIGGSGGGSPYTPAAPAPTSTPPTSGYQPNASAATVPTDATTSTPAVYASAAPASVTPAAASNGSCTPGQYTCEGDKIGICNNGANVIIGCPPSTSCRKTGDNVACQP